MKETLIISAFPGTGKTYLKQHATGVVLDSDSSLFSWIEKGVRHPDFPNNYIKHIKENMGKADLILVSSHKEVRVALMQAGIPFVVAYPQKHLKAEYLERYKRRGSPEGFITLMDTNWDSFIEGMEQHKDHTPIVLKSGQYLADFFLLNQGETAEPSVATEVESSTSADPQISSSEEAIIYRIVEQWGNAMCPMSEMVKWLKDYREGEADRLREEVERLKGERQWISVKDRLPYKDGDSQIFCLVWDTYEGHAVVRPYNEYHKCWDGEDADDFYTDATEGNISHWMPLPPKP